MNENVVETDKAAASKEQMGKLPQSLKPQMPESLYTGFSIMEQSPV